MKYEWALPSVEHKWVEMWFLLLKRSRSKEKEKKKWCQRGVLADAHMDALREEGKMR